MTEPFPAHPPLGTPAPAFITPPPGEAWLLGEARRRIARRRKAAPGYFLRVRAARAIRMAEASAIPDRNVMATSVGAVA